jgi:3-hydroxyisobutyrate dehydrogenase-like beta-hydroxyacid dehydrogenase
MRVSILGLGGMGTAFAHRALEAGHEVRVWNRSPGKGDALVTQGARAAVSAADAVAGAGVVLLVVSDDEAVRQVCLGEDRAVLRALAPEAVLTVVSTVAPATMRQIADSCPQQPVIDAPVMSSPAMILQGVGEFLVGGSDGAVESAAPLLRDLASGFTHLGPLGTGQVTKVVSNMLLITGLTAVAEGIAMARSQGVPDDALRGYLDKAIVVSQGSRFQLESVLDKAHPGQLVPQLAREYVQQAVDLAAEGGLPIRMAPAAVDQINRLLEQDRDWQDISAIIEAVR